MARPSRNRGEALTTGEISRRSGVSMRNIQFLRDRGYLCSPVDGKSGKGGCGLYAQNDAQWLYIAGRLTKMGMHLVAAVSLAKNAIERDGQYLIHGDGVLIAIELQVRGA